MEAMYGWRNDFPKFPEMSRNGKAGLSRCSRAPFRVRERAVGRERQPGRCIEFRNQYVSNAMIDGLIGGKLYGKAAQRVGQSGKPFVTAKVRTPAGDGDALFVNVITLSSA